MDKNLRAWIGQFGGQYFLETQVRSTYTSTVKKQYLIKHVAKPDSH